MIVFLNGRYVPVEDALVSVFDRGFTLGDGLFESLRVHQGRPFRWAQHFQRLERGAAVLKLSLPFSAGELRAAAGELSRRNALPDAVLRLQVTRGPGPRGLGLQGADSPTTAMTLEAAPTVNLDNPLRWRLVTASVRIVPGDPLSGIKSCNRLPWMLARAEAERSGGDVALMLNTAGQVAEADAANLFWIEREVVCTPPLSDGGLAGVTRQAVLERCSALGLATVEQSIDPADLGRAEGVFLTLSTRGIVPVTAIDGRPVAQSPLIGRIARAYWRLVEEETQADS